MSDWLEIFEIQTSNQVSMSRYSIKLEPKYEEIPYLVKRCEPKVELQLNLVKFHVWILSKSATEIMKFDFCSSNKPEATSDEIWCFEVQTHYHSSLIKFDNLKLKLTSSQFDEIKFLELDYTSSGVSWNLMFWNSNKSVGKSDDALLTRDSIKPECERDEIR